MLDDDPEFLNRFDATVAKRILKLMTDFGLTCLLCFVMGAMACGQTEKAPVQLGNAQTDEYLPLLLGRQVALVGNHTSMVGDVHLVDTLLSLGVNIQHVFAPEHGFRGEAANGAEIQDGTDVATGLPVFSLHGAHRKPQPQQLEMIDVVVFDIQDVGARFYTYISSLMLVMEACAKQGVDVVVLDRPNPHGHHMQGPMLDPAFQSFVGLIPAPLVHGLTLGEAATMGCAEGWVEVPEGWRPSVVKCTGWSHGTDFQPAVRPSPNLPTTAAIDLYPSLCLFEPTAISVGRGTEEPFTMLGHPDLALGSHEFTPKPIEGAAPHPKYEYIVCTGQRLNGLADAWRMQAQAQCGQPLPSFSLSALEDWAEAWRDAYGNLDGFITSPSFFDKLAGTDSIRIALEQGIPLATLETHWQRQHRAFFDAAKPHLLYPWNAPVPGD